MVINLLDRELKPINGEHTKNACTAGYFYIQAFLSKNKEWKQFRGFVCWYNVKKRKTKKL